MKRFVPDQNAMLVNELEERLIQVAGHAIGKVLEAYKRKPRLGEQLARLKLLEEVAQRIEVLNLQTGALARPESNGRRL